MRVSQTTMFTIQGTSTTEDRDGYPMETHFYVSDSDDNILVFTNEDAAQKYMEERGYKTRDQERDAWLSEANEAYDAKMRQYEADLVEVSKMRRAGVSARLLPRVSRPYKPSDSHWRIPDDYYAVVRARVVE